MKIENRPGYMLVLSLLLISSIVVVVTLVFSRSAIFISFSNTVIKKEQAQRLALSGIQLAISQLSEQPKEEEGEKKKEQEASQKEEKKKDPAEEQAQFLLETILPTLNRWQQVELNKKTDGIDGEIRFALSCEQGKININQIFDFQKGKFKGEGTSGVDWKKMLKDLLKKGNLNAEKIVDALGSFLSKHKVPLEDVTQLLSIKEFEPFKDQLWYVPPTRTKQDQRKEVLFLTDIFTVVSGSSQIQPWLFSDSLLGLLGLKRAQVGDVDTREKMVDGWLKKFKRQTDWQKEWDTIAKPMYEKNEKQLPKKIVSVLDNSFDPTLFSVISYGTVEDTRQRLFAILERKKQSRGNSPATVPAEASREGRETGKPTVTVTIKRIYWL